MKKPDATPRIITVTEHYEQYSGEWPCECGTPLETVIAWFQAKLAAISKRYRGAAGYFVGGIWNHATTPALFTAPQFCNLALQLSLSLSELEPSNRIVSFGSSA